jgi:ankyrin repeat protein
MRVKGSLAGATLAHTDRSLDQIASAYEHQGEVRKFVTTATRDHDHDTLLHRAAHRGSAQDVWDLLQLGCDIDAKGDMGLTALHYAAMEGARSVVVALLAGGASCQLRNEWGRTAAETAALHGHEDLACLILEHEKWKGG